MIWLAIAAYLVYAYLFGYYVVDDKDDHSERALCTILVAPMALVASPIIAILAIYYYSMIYSVKSSTSNINKLLQTMNYSNITTRQNYSSPIFEPRDIPLIIEGEHIYCLTKAQRVYMNMRYKKAKAEKDRKVAEEYKYNLEIKAGRALLGKPPRELSESPYLRPEQ